MANCPLAGEFRFILDGVQGDADFVAAMFQLQRGSALHTYMVFLARTLCFTRRWFCCFYLGSYRHRQCCYLCNAVSATADGESNDLLYTNWGRDAVYRQEHLSCIPPRASQRTPWLQWMARWRCLQCLLSSHGFEYDAMHAIAKTDNIYAAKMHANKKIEM